MFAGLFFRIKRILDGTTLTTKIMLFALLIIVVFIFMQAGFEYLVLYRQAELFRDTAFRNHDNLKKAITNRSNTNTGLSNFLAANPDVKTALTNKDRTALLKVTEEITKQLLPFSDTPVYIHFHVPPGRSFLRVWEPEIYGDDLTVSRPMVKQVFQNGIGATGIESGRSGLAIRSITPVQSYTGAVIGSVEVFSRLNDIVNSLGSMTGEICLVFNTSEPEGSAQRLDGLKIGRFVSYNSMPSGVPVHKINESFLEEGMKAPAAFILDGFALTAAPITDWSNQVKGVYLRIIPNPYSQQLRQIISIDEHIMVTLILSLVILLAGFFWGKSLVNPLKQMTELLQQLKDCTGNTEAGCTAIISIPVQTNDEVGQVAKAVNDLVHTIRELSIFRRTIEADETVEDIYMRLARVFEHQLSLGMFVIYEFDVKQDALMPIYCQPPEIQGDLPELLDDRCRAKRTGAVVSSIDNPGICRLFPWPDALTHTCIPMTIGGQVVGVVQFMFPYVDNPMRQTCTAKALQDARRYLQEAMPVIQAKRYARAVEEMAVKDQLTGLYNRRYLELYIDNILSGVKRRNSTLCILMCDIDYFKKVNDEYGHDAGDIVLKELGHILASNVRAADLVIRFGGEEFLVLLIDCATPDAMAVAEKLRDTFENHIIRLPGQNIKKTLSIGVSEFPTDSDAIWEAIKFADIALYKAKEAGRNKVMRFTPDMWQEKSY
ncbi:MAG: diguanylate cyclase [Dissulfuribacterales bacterium]